MASRPPRPQRHARRPEERSPEVEAALRNSRLVAEPGDGALASLPPAPTLRPTEAEWRDPVSYLERVALPAAAPFGLALVVPPAAWLDVPSAGGGDAFVVPPSVSRAAPVPTLAQQTHRLGEGLPFEGGRTLAVDAYAAEAAAELAAWLALHPPPGCADEGGAGGDGGADGGGGADPACSDRRVRHVEREFWRAVKGGAGEVTVEYANDLDSGVFGSAMGPGGGGWWRLAGLARAPGSCFAASGGDIPGVTRPWLYLGRLFAAFCWRVACRPACFPALQKENEAKFQCKTRTPPASSQAHGGPRACQRQRAVRGLPQSVVRRAGFCRVRPGPLPAQQRAPPLLSRPRRAPLNDRAAVAV